MFDRDQFLKEIKNRDPHLGIFLEKLIDGVDGLSNHAGFDPTGKVAPPAPLQGVNVTGNNGDVHITLTHNTPISKNIRYFVEADTNPAFPQPHVFDLGASRSHFTRLPNKDGGGNQLKWYFRGYSQYPGSDPSPAMNFGPKFNPSPVTVGGTTQFTPLASTGSGTAQADGTKGGQGIGVVLQRFPVGPKRSAAPSAVR
jgi:hypothetical protein